MTITHTHTHTLPLSNCQERKKGHMEQIFFLLKALSLLSPAPVPRTSLVHGNKWTTGRFQLPSLASLLVM